MHKQEIELNKKGDQIEYHHEPPEYLETDIKLTERDKQSHRILTGREMFLKRRLAESKASNSKKWSICNQDNISRRKVSVEADSVGVLRGKSVTPFASKRGSLEHAVDKVKINHEIHLSQVAQRILSRPPGQSLGALQQNNTKLNKALKPPPNIIESRLSEHCAPQIVQPIVARRSFQIHHEKEQLKLKEQKRIYQQQETRILND